MKIGFLGLGVMGLPMAKKSDKKERLRGAGL